MNREKPQWRGKKKEKEKLEKEVWYLSFLFFTSLFLQSMVRIFSNFYALFSVSIFTFFLIYIYFFCSRFSWFEWLWFQSFNSSHFFSWNQLLIPLILREIFSLKSFQHWSLLLKVYFLFYLGISKIFVSFHSWAFLFLPWICLEINLHWKFAVFPYGFCWSSLKT